MRAAIKRLHNGATAHWQNINTRAQRHDNVLCACVVRDRARRPPPEPLGRTYGIRPVPCKHRDSLARGPSFRTPIPATNYVMNPIRAVCGGPRRNGYNICRANRPPENRFLSLATDP